MTWQMNDNKSNIIYLYNYFLRECCFLTLYPCLPALILLIARQKNGNRFRNMGRQERLYSLHKKKKIDHQQSKLIKIICNELAVYIRRPNYWSFSYSISLSNEYSQLISFKTDWFDILVVQETLKSFLQHHSSKASILLCSAFFMVQLHRV